jgi:hypothetical protein
MPCMCFCCACCPCSVLDGDQCSGHRHQAAVRMTQFKYAATTGPASPVACYQQRRETSISQPPQQKGRFVVGLAAGHATLRCSSIAGGASLRCSLCQLQQTSTALTQQCRTCKCCVMLSSSSSSARLQVAVLPQEFCICHGVACCLLMHGMLVGWVL